MDRRTILFELQRTAAENGGQPLGKMRLDREAGIKEHHWRKYWPRLSDAYREAGITPNDKTVAIDRGVLLRLLAEYSRELGRFPTHAEIRVRSGEDARWPSVRVFDKRFGTKADMMRAVADFCCEHSNYADVLGHCAVPESNVDAEEVPEATSADGFVYLLKSGRHYKIGKTSHAGQRERDLAIQLPERATMVHTIKTDDPQGIERYWHQRFAEKRLNGEWFALERADIAAFRRRRFM